MFIRIKGRRNASGREYSYAYLVSNRWKGSSSRQSVKGYLGRVYSFERHLDKGELPVRKSFRGTILALLAAELKAIGFSASGELFSMEGIEVDLVSASVMKGKFPVVVELNEGFLCDYTLKRLLNFRLRGEDALEAGRRLAERLVEAGILVPQETFVGMFNKFYSGS